MDDETVYEEDLKGLHEYIRSALSEDERQQKETAQERKESAQGESAFPQQDDRFLRLAYTLYQVTNFRNHGTFYDTVYKLSLAKFDIDYAKTYPADTYVADAQSLKGLVPVRPPAQIKKFGSGYPLAPAPSGSRVTHRVYLNPDPRHAIEVYKYFLEQKMPAQADEGIVSSKLGDYEIVTTCRDVIVIYLSGSGMIGKIGEALKKYQNIHPDHFMDEIPVMTAPLPGLRGVGYAEDLPPLPDDNEVYKYWSGQDQEWQATHPWITENSTMVNLSHSAWRSVFILAALRMSGPGGIDKLRANLTKIATVAGLTPSTMHARPNITPDLVALIANELFPQ